MPEENNGKFKRELYAEVQVNRNNINDLKVQVDKICSNHIPHIQKGMQNLEKNFEVFRTEINTKFDGLKKSTKLVGGIVTGAVLINIIVNLLFK